jgi:hypothetical protein
MIPIYTIEYTTKFQKRNTVNHYSTDDPVTCEQAIEELLERGLGLKAIKHEGVDLPKQDFDKMIQTAAGMLASKHICGALGIKPEEERYRFGFSA